MRPFEEEQARLAERIRRGECQFVFLDPDGTLSPWLAVVIRRGMGVVYGTQCAGVATDQRFVEGYLVPLNGSKYDVDGALPVGITALNDVFHEDDKCSWGSGSLPLPADRLAKLSTLVEQIPYWCCRLETADSKHSLRLDMSRIDEMAEGWVPVTTPDGSGVLVYRNCD